MLDPEVTDYGVVDAVHDLLCDHGWAREQAHGPPGLETHEIPGRVADVIAEVERLRARVAELEEEIGEWNSNMNGAGRADV